MSTQIILAELMRGQAARVELRRSEPDDTGQISV